MDIISEKHAIGGSGTFILGDALSVARSLFDSYENKIQLIYLDPPFRTGDTFKMRVNGKNKTVQLTTYSDKLSHESYMDFMHEILLSCRRLLSDTGSIYVHIDHRMNAYIRLLMDEVFGEKNFLNEIIWVYRSGGRATRHFSRKHDVLLFYQKTARNFFDISAVGTPRGKEKRNNMKRLVDEDGRVFYTIRSAGRVYKYYENTPVFPSDVWTDIAHLNQRDPERTGYNTQKPEALLSRIILSSSREGDIVADLFSGSGTTAHTAASLGRRFIAADSSPIALMTLRERRLSAARHTNMFADDSSFNIEYTSPQRSRIPVKLIASANKGLISVTLGKYTGNTSISYFAIGSVHDGVFVPCAFALKPAAGTSLTTRTAADDIYIQLCDQSGKTEFRSFSNLPSL